MELIYNMENQFPTDPAIKNMLNMLNMMKNVKQKILLENSFYTIKHEVSKEMYTRMSHSDLETITKQQIIELISKMIYLNIEKNIDIEAFPERESLIYSINFMLFKKQEMTSIIEYIIKNMSEEDLTRIRNKE